MASKLTQYNVGLYMRLSKEDEDKTYKTDDSGSIKNQCAYLHDYVNNLNAKSSKEKFVVCREYIDDGISGTSTLKRDALAQMTDDIEAGIINCVIVKDLSRLARNSALQWRMIHEYFPDKNVRFISIFDNYDNINGVYSESAELMGFLNENRSRRLSTNIKEIFRVKAEKGEFIGAFASFGYMRDPNNKNHFIIDEEAAEIVRMIFDLYMSGTGQIGIANILNEQNIPTPSEYKRRQGLNYKNSNERLVNQWTYSTVHRILKNKMLVGDMWQRRNKRGKFDRGSSQYLEEENIIVANTHEAIINREDFEFVQNKLKNNRDVSENLKNNVSIYAKLLRCECGHPMAKITNKYKYKDGSSKTVVRYVCRNYKQNSQNCASHRVFETELNDAVLTFLNDCIRKIKKKDELIKKAAKSKNQKQNIISKQLNSAKKQLESADKKIERLLDLYLDGTLDKEVYNQKKEALENLKSTLQERISQLNREDPKTEEELFLADPFIKQLLEVGEFKELTKQIVDTFISLIIVSEDESKEITLEIIPTFSNPEE